jgi:excisionase family DNA binding protein
MDSDPALTVNEAAQRLRITRDTLRRWLREGRIRGVSMGSDRAGYRIKASEVERVLEEGPREPGS